MIALQARLVSSVFHSWQQSVEGTCLHRQEAFFEVAHKADRRTVATALAGWWSLHQVEQKDRQCIQFCRR